MSVTKKDFEVMSKEKFEEEIKGYGEEFGGITYGSFEVVKNDCDELEANDFIVGGYMLTDTENYAILND